MNTAKNRLKRIPGLFSLYWILRSLYNGGKSAFSPYVQAYPAGHFYSPLPDRRDLMARRDELLRDDVYACPGIELREQAQLDLLRALAEYYDELPFPDAPGGPGRYHFRNLYFSYGDGIVLYALLRHLRPARVIEVGSGFSSALMLDTDEVFLDSQTSFTFIEPYLEQIAQGFRDTDTQRHHFIQNPVQAVDLAFFDTLQSNDILFVDSSHVVKAGSDVATIIFAILPRLKPGVYVHFHDVPWPFEYLEEWLVSGIAWNEAYFLRAFLQYNRAFEIALFNSYMARFHRAEIARIMPKVLHHPGSSLWLRKVAI